MAYALDADSECCLLSDELALEITRIGFFTLASYCRERRLLNIVGGAFLLFFVRSYFLHSDGKDYWKSCIVGSSQHEQERHQQGSFNNMKRNLVSAWGDLLRGTSHELQVHDRSLWGWLRGECWVLKNNNSSAIVRTNRRIFEEIGEQLNALSWQALPGGFETMTRMPETDIADLREEEEESEEDYFVGPAESPESVVERIWRLYRNPYLQSLKAIVADVADTAVPPGWLRTLRGIGRQKSASMCLYLNGNYDLVLRMNNVDALTQGRDLVCPVRGKSWMRVSELMRRGFDVFQDVFYENEEGNSCELYHREERIPAGMFVFSGPLSREIEALSKTSNYPQIVVVAKSGLRPEVVVGQSSARLLESGQLLSSEHLRFYRYYLPIADSHKVQPLVINGYKISYVAESHHLHLLNSKEVSAEGYDAVVTDEVLRIAASYGAPRIHTESGCVLRPSIGEGGYFEFTHLPVLEKLVLRCRDNREVAERSLRLLCLPKGWQSRALPVEQAEMKTAAEQKKLLLRYPIGNGEEIRLKRRLDVWCYQHPENSEMMTVYTGFKDARYEVEFKEGFHTLRYPVTVYNGLAFDKRNLLRPFCLEPLQEARLLIYGNDELRETVTMVYHPVEPYFTRSHRLFVPRSERNNAISCLKLYRYQGYQGASRYLCSVPLSSPVFTWAEDVSPLPLLGTLQDDVSPGWVELELGYDDNIFSESKAVLAKDSLGPRRTILGWNGSDWGSPEGGTEGRASLLKWRDGSAQKDVLADDRLCAEGMFKDNVCRFGKLLMWNGEWDPDFNVVRGAFKEGDEQKHCLLTGFFSLWQGQIITRISLTKSTLRNGKQVVKVCYVGENGTPYCRVLNADNPEGLQTHRPALLHSGIGQVAEKVAVWVESEPLLLGLNVPGYYLVTNRAMLLGVCRRFLSTLPSGGRLNSPGEPQMIRGVASFLSALSEELVFVSPRAAELLLLALAYEWTHSRVTRSKTLSLTPRENGMLNLLMMNVTDVSASELKRFLKFIQWLYLLYPYSEHSLLSV